jgi:hypothetical protein
LLCVTHVKSDFDGEQYFFWIYGTVSEDPSFVVRWSVTSQNPFLPSKKRGLCGNSCAESAAIYLGANSLICAFPVMCIPPSEPKECDSISRTNALLLGNVFHSLSIWMQVNPWKQKRHRNYQMVLGEQSLPHALKVRVQGAEYSEVMFCQWS